MRHDVTLQKVHGHRDRCRRLCLRPASPLKPCRQSPPPTYPHAREAIPHTSREMQVPCGEPRNGDERHIIISPFPLDQTSSLADQMIQDSYSEKKKNRGGGGARAGFCKASEKHYRAMISQHMHQEERVGTYSYVSTLHRCCPAQGIVMTNNQISQPTSCHQQPSNPALTYARNAKMMKSLQERQNYVR